MHSIAHYEPRILRYTTLSGHAPQQSYLRLRNIFLYKTLIFLSHKEFIVATRESTMAQVLRTKTTSLDAQLNFLSECVTFERI